MNFSRLLNEQNWWDVKDSDAEASGWCKEWKLQILSGNFGSISSAYI